MLKSYNLLPFEQPITKKKYRKNGDVYYENSCVLCEKIVTYKHGEKPEICPYCKQEDYVKPTTETRLFHLQNKFLDNRDKEILGSMYILMKDYAGSLIKKVLPRSFTYHYDKVDEKASDAVNTIIDYYLNNEMFQIEKSFAGYINTKVREVLWSKKNQQEDNHESIYSYINSDIETEILNAATILDLDSLFPQFDEYLDREQTKSEILEGIEALIESIAERIKEEYGYYYQLLSLLGVYFYVINQGDIGKFYDNFQNIQIKELVDKCMVIVYEFIKEH